MDLRLSEKRVLVTGSTSGIGEAIALALAAEGASVLVHGRRKTAAEDVADSISGSGGRSETALGDLATPEGREHVVRIADEAFGGVDVLVSAAAVYPAQDWLTTTSETWAGLYANNAVPVAALAQDFVPGMVERGWGRIITVADIAATRPLPGAAAYTASKAAVLHLAVGLARELAGTGVTSNAVSPGLIRTPGSERMFGDLATAQGWPTDWEELEPLLVEHLVQNPAGRAGNAEEVADVVTFLASPRAGYVNGTNVRVDGGAVGMIA